MTLRVALIGCGAMSREWLDAASKMEGIAIVGLADIDLTRARSRRSEFGLGEAMVARDVEALTQECHPEILFDVTTPGSRHAVVSAGLKAGCDVLSEKPMAMSLVEARDLISRAETATRLYAVMQNYRYNPQVRRIARLIASGAIGKITSVHVDLFLAPHFGGFREEMEHVLLQDMAIHAFDVARCLTRLCATGVFCKEWDPSDSWFRQGSSACAVFELEGGAVFTYRGSWAAEGLQASWQGVWRVQGTLGSITWDGADSLSACVAGSRVGLLASPKDLPVPPLVPEDRIGGHLGVIRDFITAVGARTDPETIGKDNIRSLAMVFGAIKSAEEGRQVSISQ